MFCPKCGTNLPNNSEFCSNCGANLNNFRNNDSETTTTEIFSYKIHNFLNSIVSKINKYKKQLLIGIGCFIVTLSLFLIYNVLFGFEKLSWNKEYNDYKLDYVTQNKIKLGINFSNENKINQLKIKTNCGNYEKNDLELVWDLSDNLGQCKIEVKYKLKKISKKYTVINPDVDNSTLALEYIIDENSDEDLDLDGLTNKQEKEYGTNMQLFDTDMDGLDDYYELFTSKTNPNKEDTDEDGLNDYDEIELGLNPLKADSKEDGILDGNRKVSYTVQNEKLGITLEISGTGNIPSSTINTFKNSTFKQMAGLLDNVYNFYTTGKIDNAKVIIPYSIEEIESQGLNEDKLTLYYFNEETKDLENISTIIDKENKQIIANLSHFSKYVIGDSDVVLTNHEIDIMFVIDNSISMYSESQMVDAGYNSSTGAIGNDTTFKRLVLTNNMIDMFTGNYKFGIAEFSGNYVNLKKFTAEKSEAKSAVESMKSNWNSNADGTNIVIALKTGISEFSSSDENNHYLILLTDGKNTEGSLTYNKSTIITNAKNKNVKVCVIGLGNEIDSEDLNEIAESTGCDYYNANNSSALDEIYAIIGADINYNLVDTDTDGNTNGMVIADSGFIVTKNGFSFPNYSSNLSEKGHCYGMATIAELYYTKTLPKKLSEKNINDYTSYGYNFTSTYFASFNNLYDYKLQTNALKYNFGYDLFGEDVPTDYLTLSGDTVIFSEDLKQEILDTNIYDFSIVKSNRSKKDKIKYFGFNFEYIEKVQFNEDKMQNSTVVNSDKQILNAIYTAFIKQFATTEYSSATNWLLWIGKILKVDDTSQLNSSAFIELLKNRLESGDVPVISANFSGGITSFHSINAISLIQDSKDANHYYIGVYDNNYPGEKRYVDIQCNKNSCVTVANDFYENSNQPIKISLSLESDLEFFK